MRATSPGSGPSVPEGLQLRYLTRDDAHVDSRPCFSPDGSRVLFMRAPAGEDPIRVANDDASPWEFCTVPSAGGAMTSLLRVPGLAATRPDWCRISNRIAFTGIRDGEAELWLLDASSGQLDRIAVGSPRLTRLYYPAWYPDGERIAVTDYATRQVLEVDPRTGSARPVTDPRSLWVGMASVRRGDRGEDQFAMAGQPPSAAHDVWRNAIWLQSNVAPARPLATGSARMPSWSPDGEYLACATTGGLLRRTIMRHRARIVVQRVRADLRPSGPVVPITPWSSDAAHPRWAPDGRSLTCMLDDSRRSRHGIAVVALPEPTTQSRSSSSSSV